MDLNPRETSLLKSAAEIAGFWPMLKIDIHEDGSSSIKDCSLFGAIQSLVNEDEETLELKKKLIIQDNVS